MKSKVRWPTGKTINKLASQCREYAYHILNMSILAVDPASVTTGWAMYEGGKLTESGVWDLNKKNPMQERLQRLDQYVHDVGTVEILCIEDASHAYMSHKYLSYAMGTVIGATDSNTAILWPTVMWKPYAAITPGYVKSDESDAIVIGASLIEFTKYVVDNPEKYVTVKKK